MNRRHALRHLSALSIALPGLVLGQPSAMPKIGVLLFPPMSKTYQQALRRGLQSFGYVEGKNIAIDWRSADSNVQRAEKLAAELVAVKVNVIIAYLTPAAAAAKKATATIPIVMAYVGDPVGGGLVKSLARPEANITGLSASSAELSGKRIQLVREVIPELARVGIVINGSDPFAKPFVAETVAAGKHANVIVDVVDTRPGADPEPLLERLKHAGARAVIIQGSLDTARWAEAAIKRGMPTMATQKHSVAAGMLIYFGPDADDLIARAGSYVDRLLRGAKPGDLPIEQPTRMELIVNRKTAKALGLEISPAFLSRANSVID
ncbi:MAG: ABC transporter substrate-binding protein [Planctomycetia bacterium]|nr:ABC transporter substrate-binding protein [Planctomycetia bacterium]